MNTKLWTITTALFLFSCDTAPEDGQPGPAGPQGPQGPQGPAGGGDTAGSRLKPRVIAGADGSRFTVGIWDSQRAELCRFVIAEDMKTRCLPVDNAINYGWESETYANDKCTERLYGIPLVMTQPVSYAIDLWPTAPAGVGSIWALTPIDKPVAGYQIDSATKTCVRSNVGDNRRFHRGVHIDPAAFVEGAAQ